MAIRKSAIKKSKRQFRKLSDKKGIVSHISLAKPPPFASKTTGIPTTSLEQYAVIMESVNGPAFLGTFHAGSYALAHEQLSNMLLEAGVKETQFKPAVHSYGVVKLKGLTLYIEAVRGSSDLLEWVRQIPKYLKDRHMRRITALYEAARRQDSIVSRSELKSRLK